MPITFEQTQTVAVGPFNPYIITPDWLFRWAVCKKDVEWEDGDWRFFSGTIADGTAFMIGRMEWEVDHHRLIVSSPTLHAEEDETCGEKVAKVMELLKHTPVEAVGHNFHFSSSLEEWGERPLPQLGSKGVREASARQFRWVGVFDGDRDGAQIEVALAVSTDEGIAIRFNYDRRTDPLDNSSAVTAARQLKSDYRHCEDMLRQLFQTEVEP